MNFKNQKFLSAAALFLIFAVSQVYIGVSFAEPNGGVTPSAPQQLMGILTTRNDQPILVNGVSTPPGASIPSGAMIQTPDGVGATINIGGLGSVCIAPNTRFAIDFSQQGNGGEIKLNVSQGCVILTTNKNVKGSINVGQASSQTDGGTIDACIQPGEAPKINQAAAAAAGAGASGLGCAPPAGAAAIPPGGLFGLSRTATAAIFAGTGGVVACIVFCNPSPSTP